MNPTQTCSNHDTIPHYGADYHVPLGMNRQNPSDAISYTNNQLAKLTPKGQMVAKVIGMIALAVFPLISAIIFQSTLLIYGTSFLACICGVVIVLECKDYRNEINTLEKEIDDLFKKYTNEFIFIDKRRVPLITLADEDGKLIKPYIESYPLQYKITEGTHYKLDGGVIGTWAVTPLRLEEVCKKTNSEKTKEHYQPWVNLLVNLAKTGKVPPNFLKLIGKMCGFKRSLFDMVLFSSNQYNAIYQTDKKQIACIHTAGPLKNCVITTPEECLAFVTREFLQN